MDNSIGFTQIKETKKTHTETKVTFTFQEESYVIIQVTQTQAKYQKSHWEVTKEHTIQKNLSLKEFFVLSGMVVRGVQDSSDRVARSTLKEKQVSFSPLDTTSPHLPYYVYHLRVDYLDIPFPVNFNLEYINFYNSTIGKNWTPQDSSPVQFIHLVQNVKEFSKADTEPIGIYVNNVTHYLPIQMLEYLYTVIAYTGVVSRSHYTSQLGQTLRKIKVKRKPILALFLGIQKKKRVLEENQSGVTWCIHPEDGLQLTLNARTYTLTFIQLAEFLREIQEVLNERKNIL